MALSEHIEKLIMVVTDPAEQAILRKAFEAHEPLRAGYLRQEDYDRNLNKIKTDMQTKQAEYDSMKGWYDRNKPKHDTLLVEHEKAINENASLIAKVSELQANIAAGNTGGGGGTGNGNGNVSTESILAEVKKQYGDKIPTADQLKTLVSDALKGAIPGFRDQFVKEVVVPASKWQNDMNNIQFDHRVEFNEPLDRQAFLKFFTEGKYPDDQVAKGYNDWVNERRTKAKIEADVKKGVEAEVAKIKTNQSMPGVSAPGTGEYSGAAQRLIGQKTEAAIPENVRPGDNTLASMAAAELRAEGKA